LSLVNSSRSQPRRKPTTTSTPLRRLTVRSSADRVGVHTGVDTVPSDVGVAPRSPVESIGIGLTKKAVVPAISLKYIISVVKSVNLLAVEKVEGIELAGP